MRRPYTELLPSTCFWSLPRASTPLVQEGSWRNGLTPFISLLSRIPTSQVLAALGVPLMPPNSWISSSFSFYRPCWEKRSTSLCHCGTRRPVSFLCLSGCPVPGMELPAWGAWKIRRRGWGPEKPQRCLANQTASHQPSEQMVGGKVANQQAEGGSCSLSSATASPPPAPSAFTLPPHTPASGHTARMTSQLNPS